MHPNKRFVTGIEQRSFCRDAVDRIRSIEHNNCDAAFFTGAHAKVHRPDKGVVTRADILKIDEQNIEMPSSISGVGSRCSPYRAVNRNAKPRMLVAFPFDHVVLGLTEKSVLRTKERGETK